MSAETVKYFFKEGFKNVWSNRVMSAASVLVMICCMVLTGGAVLISMNLGRALKTIENKNSMTVFLKMDIRGSAAVAAGEEIANIPNILNCEYYSSQQASEKYKDVLGRLYEVVTQEGENPFPEAFHITMEDLSLYNETIEKIQALEAVESVSDRRETAKKLSDLNELIAKGGVVIVICLGVVSLFIISNTIKITMHNRRFEISIMKSVGATNSFIKTPFIIEGIIIGLVAAGLSTVLLNLVYNGLLDILGGIVPFHSVYFEDVLWHVLGCFSLAGVFLGVTGGLISLRRYLSKEGGEVVAW